MTNKQKRKNILRWICIFLLCLVEMFAAVLAVKGSYFMVTFKNEEFIFLKFIRALCEILSFPVSYAICTSIIRQNMFEIYKGRGYKKGE